MSGGQLIRGTRDPPTTSSDFSRKMAAFVRLLAKKGADDSVEHGDFHVKCGSNIVLSHERRTAHVKALSGGTVYSSKPIPAGGMFQVKVLQKTFIPGIVSDLMAGKLYTDNVVVF